MDDFHVSTWLQMAAGHIKDVTPLGIATAEAELAKRYSAIASSDDSKPSKPYEMNGNVAVINISGIMNKSADYWMYMYGGTPTNYVEKLVSYAGDDKDVSSILLVVDSPGGNVSGVSELADTVSRVNKTKPVWAFGESQVCSAAYWVASQCERLIIGKTTMVGSIGVLTSIVDQSGVLKDSPIKIKKVSTGPYKGIGSYFSPVTKEQEAHILESVQSIGKLFVEGINAGRNLNITLGEGLADGREWIGKDAVSNKLADMVSNKADTLERMQASSGMRKTSGFYASGFGAERNDFYMSDSKTEGGLKDAVKNVLASLGINIEDKSKGIDVDAAKGEQVLTVSLAETLGLDASAEDNEIVELVNKLKADAVATDENLALHEAVVGNTCEALGLDPNSGFEAINAALSSVKEMREDLKAARDQAFSELAAETNRAYGAGTATAEVLAETLASKRISDIYKATEPLRAIAEKRFSTLVDDATPEAADNRQTINEGNQEDDVDAERMRVRRQLSSLHTAAL
jgi:signal peptide peptidase SppA